MAPEMFEGKRITESVDIYSFGILLWECYTGTIRGRKIISGSVLNDKVWLLCHMKYKCLDSSMC